MTEAVRLKAIMARYGVRCSIELQPGRPWTGDQWYSPKLLRMHHHTATYPRQGLTPALGICKRGRSDVPGPLCNGYGGYDLVYRIITLGLANHPGAGGPITIDDVTVPKDSARISTWGTEWEGGYTDWTPGFREFMGRADVALAEWLDRSVTSQLEHKTWAPGRKTDRLNFDRTVGIALTSRWAATLAPEPPTTPTTPPKEDGDDMWNATDAEKIERKYVLAHQLWLAQTAAEQSVSDALAAKMLAEGKSVKDTLTEVEKIWKPIADVQAKALAAK